MNTENLVLASLGGILPSLVWLWFWLKEDRLHPEPRKILLGAFVAGMVTVPLVLPFQKYALNYIGIVSPILLFLAWAGIEEIFKFIASWTTALRKKECDEPIDAMIYLLTTALGFSALENIFFLLNPLENGSLGEFFMTGNFRFMGASLLHVVASAFVGIAIAFSFRKSKLVRTVFITCGLLGAIALHTVFNLLIIEYTNYPAFTAFIGVWIAVIILMLVFEKVKRIN